jgi:transcriptional regulator with XRE-family HTH domain
MTPKQVAHLVKRLGSREALAARLGVTSQAVWQWEHGGTISGQNQILLRRLAEDLTGKARIER